VTIEGQAIAARLWYDGQYINSAKEEAAELAVKTIQARGGGQAEHRPQAPQQAPRQRVVQTSRGW